MSRAKCDYCGKRRMLDRSGFCKECVEHWIMVVDKYMDGDPLTALVYAEATLKELENADSLRTRTTNPGAS